MTDRTPPTVAIAGLGSIGRSLVPHLLAEARGYRLTAVASGRADRARRFLDQQEAEVAVVEPAALPEHADIVIECAPSSAYAEIATPVIEAGRTLITLSVGALLDCWSLVDLARRSGGRILVPTGALAGLDTVQALAQGTITSVRMVTRKPVSSLADAPFVAEKGIDLKTLHEPSLMFEGSVREAISGFPANLNVAVALSLAGIGPDRTSIEVWADPALQRNTHRILVESDAADLDLSISNVPSDNPATGRSTALSVLALLDKLASPLQVGT